jgi:molybdate transport system substrate-binding protein
MKISVRIVATIFVTFVFLAQAGIIGAAEIKVLSAVVIRPVLGDLTSEFERTTGHKITIDFATSGVLRSRIQAGELADITILPRPMMDALLKDLKVIPGSEAILARGTVGVAVRAGAAKPDISTVEGLRRSLLASKSIVYGNPAQGSASGIHFARVLEQLGIVEEMKPKTKLASDTGSVDSVVNGEAEIAVAGTMALLRVPGAEFVGPLPAELQNTTDFAYFAAILVGTKNLDAANALIKHLLAPTSARMIKAKGMEPG